MENGIAIIAIDHPPVNALAQPVRAALRNTVVASEANPAISAMVIHGVGRCFVAGADLREFDAPPLEPLLNDVLLRIEAVTKPVVAALHGPTLGGGLELALACHYRCATAQASIGFPEIKLALMPGSGGTQRLPRLVGAAVALEMMLGGEAVNVARALELGIVDRLIEGTDLVRGAVAYALELVAAAKGVRRLRDISLNPGAVDPANFARERARVARQSPGIVAAAHIIDCVEAAYYQPFDAALALSRRRFEECRNSIASRALRHLCFSERPGSAASRHNTRVVRTVAIIGAGTMGSGIAISLATSGHDVIMIDPQAAAVDSGLKRIASTIEASAGKGRISHAAATAAISRVSGAHELIAAVPADLVIEAVFESLAVKQDVFRTLDQLCRAETVLATNTSTLDIDAIASVTARSQQVVGMHFFSPANIMRLVEIVRGSASSAETIATAMSVARNMGKLGIVVGNCCGFVGNRMLYAYGRENQFMLLEGASPSQVDAALRHFGMAMGPNAVGDLAGLDVGYCVRRERADRSADPRYYRVADLLVEAGRLGQKSGRGVFRYQAGSREPLPDTEVEALISAESQRMNIARRAVADDEIVERCIFSLINEGARILDDGIASCAADIDAIWCNGYGFPRLRGGPMFHADTVGLSTVLATIERYATKLGAQYWTPAPLLVDLAGRGSSFAEWDQIQLTNQTRAGELQ